MHIWKTTFDENPKELKIEIESELKQLSYFESDLTVLLFENGKMLFINPELKIEEFRISKKSFLLEDEKCLRVINKHQLEIFHFIPSYKFI